MRLLGPDWVQSDREGKIKGTEEKAARTLLDGLGGVSLETSLPPGGHYKW